MSEKVKPPKAGIYENVPFKEYLSWDCFSKSMAKSMLKSGLHLQASLKNPPDSDAIRMGSLVDCMILEPKLFDETYTFAPETYESQVRKGVYVDKPWSYRANYCKNWRAEAEAGGLTVVSSSEYESAKLMADNVLSHHTAGKWIEEGEHQVSIVWQDQLTGVWCKARFDNLRRGVAIDDLKSTNDASLKAFQRTMANFMYHIQAAAYSDGWAIASGEPSLPFNFIVVESQEPYCCATYATGIDSLSTGKYLWNEALMAYAASLKSGVWHGYSQYPEEIDIPAYAIINDIPDEVL